MAALDRLATPAPLIHEYLIEEDEMGDSAAQTFLLAYLEAVLQWLSRPRGWFVARNLTFYHPAIRNSQQMIAPDLAVFVGIALTREEGRRLRSWGMRSSRRGRASAAARPCPPVVLEVSSERSPKGSPATDIKRGAENKPEVYGAIGVREYFAYDPNDPAVWRRQGGRRLLGWRYTAGRPVALEPDARGWLWSAELESWLGADEAYVRLYDGQGRVRLTEAEAEAAARAEAEVRLATLRAALRAHNIDPDQL